jgi:uncharacterized protein YbjT (DUF2867 family)
MAAVFLTGGTGYLGSRLAIELLGRGHEVRALVRPGSESRLPSACEAVTGDALDCDSYRGRVHGSDTFVHLVGVSHPSPAKAAQFRSIDLRSAHQAIAASRHAGVRHLVYVSVAHPAPVMHDYIAARCEAEDAIRASTLAATILRPWYVLGPGHRWPYALLPVYWLLGALPSTREAAQRFGLVTVGQMVQALARAVEDGPRGHQVLGVPEIRGNQR